MILYTSQVPSVARHIGNEDYHCLYCSKFDKFLNTYDLDDFCRIGYTFIANEMRNLPGHIEGAYPIWLTPNPVIQKRLFLLR